MSSLVCDFKIICLTFILCWSCLSTAEINKKPIELISGLDKAPFITNGAKGGLQIELIRQVFTSQNIDVKFTPMPLGRNITGYQRWNVQGVITLPSNYTYPNMFLSKPYISYQNVAVSLSRNNFTIKNIDDLSGRSVVAFQKAKNFLGEKYKGIVQYSLDYREVADQRKQVEMLFSGQMEVIILDINIFKYFMRNQAQDMYRKPFKLHYIFKKRPYSAGFKSEDLKNKFDLGILQMKKSPLTSLIEQMRIC